MVFKKIKKKLEVPPPKIQEETKTAKPTIETKEKVAETDPELEKIKAAIVDYNKNFNGVFTQQEFGNTIADTHICNLLFAVLFEMKKLNKILEVMEKQ